MTTETNKLTIAGFRLLHAQAYSTEVQLVDEKSAQDIERFCIGLVSTIKLHTFFDDKSITWLTVTIFENAAVRDFILSLDSRFFLSTDEEDKEETVRLARMLSNVCFINYAAAETRAERTPSHIPAAVLSAYTLADASASRKDIIKTLMTDRWLMTVMLLHMNYGESVAQRKRETAAAPPPKGNRTNAPAPSAPTATPPLAAVTTTSR